MPEFLLYTIVIYNLRSMSGREIYGRQSRGEQDREEGKRLDRQIDRQRGTVIGSASVCNPPATVICLFTSTA